MFLHWHGYINVHPDILDAVCTFRRAKLIINGNALDRREAVGQLGSQISLFLHPAVSQLTFFKFKFTEEDQVCTSRYTYQCSSLPPVRLREAVFEGLQRKNISHAAAFVDDIANVYHHVRSYTTALKRTS